MTAIRCIIAIIVWLTQIHGHTLDMCAMGKRGVNSVLNGNWTYMGTDPQNSHKPYWYHECVDFLAIEWGTKYNVLWNFYVIKLKNGTGRAGYCSQSDTEPYNCDSKWAIYNGTSFVVDASFMVEYTI